MILDKSTTGFLQVITLVASRTLLYTFCCLTCRHWPHLRNSLTRVEFRSILGLTLFAVLGDLVFLSGDEREGADILPLIVVQSIIWMVAAWRCARQLRQVNGFINKLNDPSTITVTSQEKYRKYQRVWWFQMGALAHFLILSSIEIILFSLLLTHYWKSPGQIYTIAQESIALLSIVFWLTSSYLDIF